MTKTQFPDWQPIESAPKDGRKVKLGWLPNGTLELEKTSHWRHGEWAGGWTPTHWRQLTAWECFVSDALPESPT